MKKPPVVFITLILFGITLLGKQDVVNRTNHSIPEYPHGCNSMTIPQLIHIPLFIQEKALVSIWIEKGTPFATWIALSLISLVLLIGYLLLFIKSRKLIKERQIRLVEVRENERRIIAKSLHDVIVGDMWLLQKRLFRNNLTEEAKELSRVNENVRNISQSLCSISFESISFKEQFIGLLADYMNSSFRIQTTGIDAVRWEPISNEIKRTLFIVVREGLQNIEKHADANDVCIAFQISNWVVTLVITDNGNGFDVEKKSDGIGLRNLKERVEDLNGQFTIKSTIEKGTKQIIEIPLK